MFKKLFFNRFFLFIILIVFSETLMNSPFQNFNIFLNLIITFLCCLIFIYYLFFEKKKKGIIFYRDYFYFIILAILPIISAYKSNLVFKQGVLDGILGNLRFYNFLIFFYFYYFFKFNKNPTQKIKKATISLAWINLVILYIIRLTMPDYHITFKSFDGLTSYSYGVSMLGSLLFIWVAFYYFSKYITTKKSINFLFFILFIGYDIVLANARITMVMLLITILFYFRNFTHTLKIKFTFLISSIIIVGYIGLITIPSFQIFLHEKSSLFENAVEVFKGNEGEDVSANARLWQMETASRYIFDNIWFGAGNLKASSKDYFLEDYFHPSDIGLIGIIFTYGLIGLLVLLFQLKFFIKFVKDQNLRRVVFINGTIYFLIFFYIKSIFTGQFVFNIGFVFILLSILYYERERNAELSIENN